MRVVPRQYTHVRTADKASTVSRTGSEPMHRVIYQLTSTDSTVVHLATPEVLKGRLQLREWPCLPLEKAHVELLVVGHFVEVVTERHRGFKLSSVNESAHTNIHGKHGRANV